MSTIDNLFHLLHTNLGSDLHLSAGSPPVLRIYGDLVRVDAPAVSSEELMAVLREMVPMERVQAFEQTGDLDFAYEIPGLARYRANFFRQNRGNFRGVPRKSRSESARLRSWVFRSCCASWPCCPRASCL